MRFYKLNGVWQSWDYLHNELGYAEHATRPTVFKSCADATWGEDVGNGYYDGDVNDMINGTFWTDADPTGWFDLDGLVWNSETYPADAAPSLLVKDGVASDALVITCEDGNYYLIRAIIDTTAWIPESEVEELGWRSPSFVVVDSTTGKVVSGCNQELTTYALPSIALESDYETYELPSISLAVPKMVIGVPITGPVQAFWFTDNGQAETVDTELVIRNGLRDADGVKVKSLDNTDYQGASVLAYMEADGDMFTSSDASFTWFGSDSLRQLFVSNQDARGKSAWSVFAAKLFHLSYVNAQLPDVQIELPINEVGTYGTSITLPTIDGEYESGGKTWKPSAWDIGAFGSSYSLTADVVAHLVFEEVQQYQEITLYLASGADSVKYTQGGVTSTFTAGVAAAYCYKLYTDEERTIEWDGYDYSNDYVLGNYRISDGKWAEYIDSVAEMPNESSPTKIGYILMDFSRLWLCTNYNTSGYIGVNVTSIVVRIYPKDQQYYSLYGGASGSAYNNVTISNGGHRSLYGVPNKGSSALIVPWGESDASLPTRTLQTVLGSAGNSVSGLSLYTGSDSFNIQNSSGASREFRAVVFTLSTPTIISYTNTTNTVVTVNSSTPATLYDNTGNTIPYDANYDYIILGAFGVSGRFYGTFGAAVTDSWAVIQKLKLTANGSGNLQVEFVGSQTLSINKIWYTKTPKPIDVNFGDPVTIPAGYTVESVKCQRLYVKAATVTHSILNPYVSFVFDGENQYCATNGTALLGAGVAPCLSIFAIVNDQGAGYWMSWRSSTTPGLNVSLSSKVLNANGVFVSAQALVSGASTNADAIANGLNSYPALFRYYDSNDVIVPYYFKVQQTLWQFQNGVFSWLGDTTTMADLAYWYNGRAVQINLRPI